jgi:predicted amidohydrolase YtcJ
VESYIQYGVGNEDIDAATGVLIETAKTLVKPLAVVVDAGLTLEAIAPALKAQEKLSMAGLAVFSTMQTAVSAISKLSRYQEFSRLNIESLDLTRKE